MSGRVCPCFPRGLAEAQIGDATCPVPSILAERTFLGDHMASPHWQNPGRQVVLCTGPCKSRAATKSVLEKFSFSPVCQRWRSWGAGWAGSWHSCWPHSLALRQQYGQWAKQEGVCKPEPQSTMVHKICSCKTGTGCERIRQLGSQ